MAFAWNSRLERHASGDCDPVSHTWKLSVRHCLSRRTSGWVEVAGQASSPSSPTATWSSTGAAPSCCSRSLQSGRRRTPSPPHLQRHHHRDRNQLLSPRPHASSPDSVSRRVMAWPSRAVHGREAAEPSAGRLLVGFCATAGTAQVRGIDGPDGEVGDSRCSRWILIISSHCLARGSSCRLEACRHDDE